MEEGDRGQATLEWVGLLLLAALLTASLTWAMGGRPPGTVLARSVAERLVCAVRLSEDCRREPKLRESYGHDLAARLRAHAPTLLYERGMTALPVDFRRCRRDACAAGPGAGPVARSAGGEPVVAFTHVIDCRPEGAEASERAGTDCSGPRAGNLYLHYWFYYPGSATAEGRTFLKRPIRKVSTALGRPSYHPDDWESYQVRIGPGGRFARASSHHGYSYELGARGLILDHRLRHRNGTVTLRRRPRIENGWGPEAGILYVSGGSHAGNARIAKRVPRTTPGHRLRLIPLSEIAAGDAPTFAVTPPWRKQVYLDPEYPGTG